MTFLEKIARAATPGPWYWERDTLKTRAAKPPNYEPVMMPHLTSDPQFPGSHGAAIGILPDTAAHIARWSPEVVLAALAVIEAARKLWQAPCENADCGCAICGAFRQWDALQPETDNG